MVLDPRTLTNEHIGTRLRDGAVDPRPGDFLGPSNAGEDGELGNPNGPTVVNPELHAVQDNRPIRPGEVSGDPDVQDAAEREHMAEWQPATVPPEPEPDPDPGDGEDD